MNQFGGFLGDETVELNRTGPVAANETTHAIVEGGHASSVTANVNSALRSFEIKWFRRTQSSAGEADGYC